MTFSKDDWRVAALAEIPSIHRPDAWAGLAVDPEFGERWHSVRAHFELASFGVNANEADAGRELIAEHDEREDGDQDELYFIARGRARFVLDGEPVVVGQGGLVCVGGRVRRAARALETPTIVLMVGATPDRRYSVPDWDREPD